MVSSVIIVGGCVRTRCGSLCLPLPPFRETPHCDIVYLPAFATINRLQRPLRRLYCFLGSVLFSGPCPAFSSHSWELGGEGGGGGQNYVLIAYTLDGGGWRWWCWWLLIRQKCDDSRSAMLLVMQTF